MNLFRSPVRRSAAVLAGAFIGLVGAVAVAGPASAHSPSASGTTTCVKDGNWTIDWSVGNDYRTDATVIKIQLSNQATLTGPLAATNVTIPANSSNDASKQVHGSTTVSDKVDGVTLTVVLKWSDGVVRERTATVQKPQLCAPTPTPTPTPSPSTPPPPPTVGEAKPILKQDCTTISIGLENPANSIEITLHFKTSKGETRTTVVPPGTTKIEKFSATPGFTVEVTVSAKGYKDVTETVPYTRPANCGATGGTGGGLPVTGAPAGFIAGGAVLLVAAGAVAFVLTRRRKVKFTA